MVAIPSAPPTQPWQRFVRPMLLASIALHGLIFFIPTPSAPEARPEQEEKVSLTQLPAAQTSPSAVATPAARPTPPPVRPTPAARPTPIVRRVVPPVRSNLIPPVRSNSVPRPAAPAPQPTTAATTPPVQAAQTTAPPATDPFVQGFPSYPNAQQGSFDGLPPQFATSGFKTDDPLTTVAGFFEAQLPSAGYRASAIVSDGEQRVYEVSRAGETQYLTLFANPNGSGATYVLTKQRLPDNLSNADLQDPAVSELTANAGSAIFATGIEWQNVDPTSDPVNRLLSSPAAFFTLPETPEARQRAGLLQAQISSGSSQAILDALSLQLEQYGIAIAPIQDYAGGSAYQLSQETPGRSSPVTAYIVLVPTSDGRTMLALWDRPPA